MPGPQRGQEVGWLVLQTLITNLSQPTIWSKLQRNIKHSPFKKKKSITASKQKTLATYTKKWQPHGPRVITTGSWWARPQNCTSSSIQAQTRERKHKRDRLVLVTQTQFVLLKALHPHQNSPKNTKLKEPRSYETHSTKPQGPRPADKEESDGERANCNGNEKTFAKGLIYTPSDTRKAVIRARCGYQGGS